MSEALREPQDEAKHTPWFIECDNEHGSPAWFVSKVQRRHAGGLIDAITVCRVRTDEEGAVDPAVKAAVKELIASANACEGINPEAVPDLLEACKEALSLLGSLLGKSSNWDDVIEDVYALLDAASTKATNSNLTGEDACATTPKKD